jgi:hypothetical protein
LRCGLDRPLLVKYYHRLEKQAKANKREKAEESAEDEHETATRGGDQEGGGGEGSAAGGGGGLPFDVYQKLVRKVAKKVGCAVVVGGPDGRDQTSQDSKVVFLQVK